MEIFIMFLYENLKKDLTMISFRSNTF